MCWARLDVCWWPTLWGTLRRWGSDQEGRSPKGGHKASNSVYHREAHQPETCLAGERRIKRRPCQLATMSPAAMHGMGGALPEVRNEMADRGSRELRRRPPAGGLASGGDLVGRSGWETTPRTGQLVLQLNTWWTLGRDKRIIGCSTN